MEHQQSVRVGGMGLSSGNYVVKVTGGDQEDKIPITVPNLSETPPEQDTENKDIRRVISKITNPDSKSLEFVKEIRLEQVNNSLLLTIQRNDKSECSAILKDPSIREYDISDDIVKTIGLLFDKLGSRIVNFANDYVKEDRKEVSFFNDILILSRSLSHLFESTENYDLLKMGSTPELLHNRVVAQLLDYYNDAGCIIRITKPKNNEGRIHDFDVSRLRCEVKTIQPIGEIVTKWRCALYPRICKAID